MSQTQNQQNSLECVAFVADVCVVRVRSPATVAPVVLSYKTFGVPCGNSSSRRAFGREGVENENATWAPIDDMMADTRAASDVEDVEGGEAGEGEAPPVGPACPSPRCEKNFDSSDGVEFWRCDARTLRSCRVVPFYTGRGQAIAPPNVTVVMEAWRKMTRGGLEQDPLPAEFWAASVALCTKVEQCLPHVHVPSQPKCVVTTAAKNKEPRMTRARLASVALEENDATEAPPVNRQAPVGVTKRPRLHRKARFSETIAAQAVAAALRRQDEAGGSEEDDEEDDAGKFFKVEIV